MKKFPELKAWTTSVYMPGVGVVEVKEELIQIEEMDKFVFRIPDCDIKPSKKD